MTLAGINVRATAGAVTDGSTETYSLGEAYPTTRSNGDGTSLTFGFDTDMTANTRDRGGTADARLAGIAFIGNTSTSKFRLDVPTGDAVIRAAFGDMANPQVQYVDFRDNGVSFATLTNVSTAAGNFADAAGNIWLDSAWGAGNVSISHTFTSNIFEVVIGTTGGSGATTFSHLSVDPTNAWPTGGGSGADGTGDSTIADFTSDASGASGTGSTGTGDSTVGDFTSTASGTASGTITTPALKNNTGTVLANETGATVYVYDVSDGSLVVTKTGQTTDASGIMTIADALIVSGTEYRIVIVLSSGAEGMDRITAT